MEPVRRMQHLHYILYPQLIGIGGTFFSLAPLPNSRFVPPSPHYEIRGTVPA